MKSYSLSHLADRTLLQALAALVQQDRATTAALLAHVAEVDERKLYASAAYPSMYLYCVHELRMSEDMAFMRIRAARTARQYPAILPALADGRLHLSGVVLLAPHLAPATADELLAAAAGKTKEAIRLLLAARFPQPDVPTLVAAMASADATDERVVRPVEASALQLVPEPVATMVESIALQLAPEPVGRSAPQLVPERVVTMGPRETPVPVAPLAPRARIAPLSPGRYALQVTVNQETHDLLRYAQTLLGHAVPSGDVATVLKRALGSLVRDLEQQKFARSARSRQGRSASHGRYVPADIRRTVWQRDGGQCTFVSERGRRCESTTRLEFDHIDPVARGGETSADRMRLRCRAHNQYAAECTFGAGFMRGKRQEARCRAAQARERVQARTQERAQARAPEQGQPRAQAAEKSSSELDVRPWLRQLGFSAEEARRGAALYADMPDAPLEQRVRVALKGLAPNCVRRAAPVASGPS